MKIMKRKVLVYLGLGSCVSAPDPRSDDHHSSMKVICSKTPSTTTMEEPVAGAKEEVFFDSKPWLDSDDEDFLSVYGDNSPVKQVNSNGDQQGRKLSELFREGSFGSESQTSVKANEEAMGKQGKSPTQTTTKLERRKSVHRCLPSLVRSLSCGDRKKRLSPPRIVLIGS